MIINIQISLSVCRNLNQGPPRRDFRTSAHWTYVRVVTSGRTDVMWRLMNGQSCHELWRPSRWQIKTIRQQMLLWWGVLSVDAVFIEFDGDTVSSISCHIMHSYVRTART